MPGFDRTGPMGEGSRTGRVLGKCTGNQLSEKESNDIPGPGRGQGRGMRRKNGRKGPGRGFGGGNR
ncbi:MAG: DUF5320 domain-containing protein [Bacteroidota bacterium]